VKTTRTVGVLGEAGAQLRRAGAKALLLATTTMHKVAGPVTEAVGLPLLHIGDATGRAVRALLTTPDHPPEPDGWPVPLFDTTALHAHEAVQWMLEETRP
jgi:aspartate/glutamate racemase